MDMYEILFRIEDEACKRLEDLRQQKLIGKSIEAVVLLEYYGGYETLPFATQALISDERAISTWCRVSDAFINVIGPKLDPAAPFAYDLYVVPGSTQRNMTVCCRCWKYTRSEHIRLDGENPLCRRCFDVVKDVV